MPSDRSVRPAGDRQKGGSRSLPGGIAQLGPACADVPEATASQVCGDARKNRGRPVANAGMGETSTVPEDDVPVLIAGGSLVGMSMAMLLGGLGVRSLVVERHRGAAIHPRAAFLLQRTMEVLRDAGIEEEVRTGSHAQFEPDGAIMSAETLAGREIAYHLPNVNEGVRDMSPCERLFVTQIGLEPMLRARAEELGADVRFGTELADFAQDATGVTAVLRERDGGATREVRAQYLVAADGPRSTVRERLGIPMTGRGVSSKAVTIYFAADVEPLLRGRNLSV